MDYGADVCAISRRKAEIEEKKRNSPATKRKTGLAQLVEHELWFSVQIGHILIRSNPLLSVCEALDLALPNE